MSYILPPKLQNLTETEVETALLDIQNHEVIEALARVADSYAKECARLRRAGKKLDLVLNQKTSCALEKLALEMTAAALKPATAKKR